MIMILWNEERLWEAEQLVLNMKWEVYVYTININRKHILTGYALAVDSIISQRLYNSLYPNLVGK